MKSLIAKVAIDGAIGSFDKEYSYKIPENLLGMARPGCRVTMPFGRSNSKRQGIILSVVEGDTAKLKELISVTDKTPVLNEEMLMLAKALHERTFCTYFDAVKAMLPVGLSYKLTPYYTANEEFDAQNLGETETNIYEYLRKNPSSTFDKIKKAFGDIQDVLDLLVLSGAVLRDFESLRRADDLKSIWLRVKDGIDGNLPKLTPRQEEIYKLVSDFGELSRRQLQYFTGVTASVINNLVSKGVLETFYKEEFRIPYRLQNTVKRDEIVLTEQQNRAYEGILEEINADKPSVSLLYGVTGSGKTQVFLKLVDFVEAKGEGVIIMVPEIALTPQIIDIFTKRYGNKIAVFHSAMSVGQRMDEYKRVKQGKARIAIGTRSAVFAPFSKLGLIIMDEEQEHTYKSEMSPRFHARDVAKLRARYHNCTVCLASATPSIESYSMALSGKYKLFSLTERYGNAILPEVVAVDMKKEAEEGNKGLICRHLVEELEKTFDMGKQAIILLNRRGHNTYVSCSSCGWVATCPNCSVSMTYHSANNRLMCHYCGYSVPILKKCPDCENERLRFMGAGTQKVEEELKLLFRDKKILRLDADTTVARGSYAKYLEEFARGDYDIMLGTQMVAKGLNFPNVTLVGVIGADKATYSEDYKGFERTFSLLTQVVGRAGRGDFAGKAIVQTNEPDSSLISLAASQDYDAFYNEEILTRKLMVYPPYCDICAVWAQSSVKKQAIDAINEIFSKLKEKIKDEYKSVKLIILGPSASSVSKVNNRYRFKIIIKCKNNFTFRELLRNATDIKLKGDTAVFVDINPETLI